MQNARIISTVSHWIFDHLVAMGMPRLTATYVNMLLLLSLVLLLLYVSRLVTRAILRGTAHRFAKKTATQFDDYLIRNRFFSIISLGVPLVIVVQALPIVFYDFQEWIKPLRTLTDIYLILLAIWTVRALLRTLKDYLKTTSLFKDKPVESFVQVLTIFLYFVGGLLIFSLLTGKSVWAFITAMGAASAILLLVFKDTILGFVASIQVSSNDMVRIGDWITMEKYGADGDVIEINLTTVKVQNFDMTITTIPTYYLISDSFKNWRGMQNAGGRRIKRSIHIKISSIRYLSPEDIQKLSKIGLIKDYLLQRQAEISAHNERKEVDSSLLINGRSLTNIGVFRKYIDAYIAQHEFTHKSMTMMVRQLEPTTTGMPIELYVFTNEVRWEKYELIMADIFDHLLAAVRYFDLQVFEVPAADDIRSLGLRVPDSSSLIPPVETMQN
ncbi:miniconductance mechanosensitive channel [Pontibacter ummariensis]|uniref:Mechanosensing system component YbdG n=1 Tax=Pontibacter ummariensis TaxID=1610492 RepID=A0A239JRK9_9BACT|nr:mechanosensitive ion channel domain-containing protein [Pontibacter ummariensis]PRY07380.1 miniconductance mechanosensitive channel [Pontibacter ummariensis]SNT08058.1 miniconductance mechanosensitive channel [Pontibacter ummariensis]